MMQVGRVRMDVRERFVRVRVGMPHARRHPRMCVQMMAVRVIVLVRVGHRLVRVRMFVARPEQERDPDRHQRGGDELARAQTLAE